MTKSNDQHTIANKISGVAVDIRIGLGVVRNLVVVLFVLGVAEENDTLDLVLDSRAQRFNRASHNGSTLATRCVSGRIEKRGTLEGIYL